MTFDEIVHRRLSRRDVMRGGLLAAGLTLFRPPGGPAAVAAQDASRALIGFDGIAVSTADTLAVPTGYAADVLYAWGDPISDGPPFRPDASNSPDEQALQAGMHHDGIEFFPLPRGSATSGHGLLALNHEYTDDGLLHPGGMATWTSDQVRKSQAAHGVSVIEVRLEGGRWRVVRPSTYARRITAATPIGFTGPAAGQAAGVLGSEHFLHMQC